MTIRLYNTLTRQKEDFQPLDSDSVRMYVCGPTVYDYAHIGNARPVIVFDVLFRLLRHVYGDEHVTYVRNVTDVDDKINARAAETAAAHGMSVEAARAEITAKTAAQFDADVAALGCLPPTHTPRATQHIGDMVAMIESLIANGHAYAASGHVLFDVGSKPDYGKLAKRSLDEMLAGARIEVAPYKKNPMDFVLWKPSDDSQPGWESPWGRGRPGWHIECSAMGGKLLGETFDIHGGGVDLCFPHHENEIAQSEGAHGKPLARYWMHNGFLQVEGEKMSKSLGNFLTIHELLKDWPGEALRFNMLKTHYRQPLDWTVKDLRIAVKTLDSWYRLIGDVAARPQNAADYFRSYKLDGSLADDLNIPAAMPQFHYMAAVLSEKTADEAELAEFKTAANFLGLLTHTASAWFAAEKQFAAVDEGDVKQAIEARNDARRTRNFAEADRIRDELLAKGIVLKDGPGGTTWEVRR